jgi:drug/metabolite transporter (DMT)-like permease
MANLSYGTALWAMTTAPIGLVGAVRETSVLFATLIAAIVLKERFGPARWAAAATIVACLMLIRLG